MQDFKNSNPILRQSISTYSKNKTQENRNRVYESISKGPLLVVVDTAPESFLLGQSSNEEYSFNMLAIKNMDNSLVLVTFSDEDAINKYESGPYLSMEAQGLLKIVQRQYNGGLVINPADQEFILNQDEVIKILSDWSNHIDN